MGTILFFAVFIAVFWFALWFALEVTSYTNVSRSNIARLEKESIMTPIPYDKPFSEQTTFEKLVNRAHIRRNAMGRKSVENNEPDRLADLLELAAADIAELEDRVAYLNSMLEGTWPSSVENELNELLTARILEQIPPMTDEAFDKLFSRVSDRVKFKVLAKYVRSIQTRSGHSYAISEDDSLGDLRAVVEQELYERLTDRE